MARVEASSPSRGKAHELAIAHFSAPGALGEIVDSVSEGGSVVDALVAWVWRGLTPACKAVAAGVSLIEGDIHLGMACTVSGVRDDEGRSVMDTLVSLRILDVGEEAVWRMDPDLRHPCARHASTAAKERLCEAMVTNSDCLLYTSPSPRDRQKSRMPSSA